MYADDTTLYCNLEDFVDCDTETAINRELQKINLWLQRNKLTLKLFRVCIKQFVVQTLFRLNY